MPGTRGTSNAPKRRLRAERRPARESRIGGAYFRGIEGAESVFHNLEVATRPLLQFGNADFHQRELMYALSRIFLSVM